MPPEILGREQQTEKVDIWCLGVLLYEMTHNRTPFNGQNIHTIQFQQKKHSIQFNPGLNPQLRTVIEKCLEFDPKKRPTAGEILALPILANYTKTGNEGTRSVYTTNSQEQNGKLQVPSSNTTGFRVPESNKFNEKNGALYKRREPAPGNYVQRPLYGQTPRQGTQTYQTSTNGKTTKEQPMPLRKDASPGRVLFQNARFKKKNEPEVGYQDIPGDAKVIKYTVSRVSGNGSQVSDARSTSATKTIRQNYAQHPFGNNTLRVTQTGAVNNQTNSFNNIYTAYSPSHGQPGPNIYSTSANNLPQQANGLPLKDSYAKPQYVNNAPKPYARPDTRIYPNEQREQGYRPKIFKYSYNLPEPERLHRPKMSYHTSNTAHTYSTTYKDNVVRRVANPEIARGNATPKGNGHLLYGNETDRPRPVSHTSNGVTTRIIRRP